MPSSFPADKRESVAGLASPFGGVLPAPSVVAVAFNEAHFSGKHFVPELQQDGTIPRFHFQGAANAGLFLPVGINVLLVVPENVPHSHRRFCIFNLGNANARAATIQFLAGMFQVGGFE